MRVLILFCEEGDGHASAARALARQLTDAGADVVVADAMRGGLGRLIPFISRDAYHLQVQRLRWTYGLEYLLFTRVPPFRWTGRRGLAFFGGRPLLRLIRKVDPDVVVSTHPAVTNILGFLRRRGRLDAPAVATITDFGVHPLWAHRGVDLHLVMHEAVVPAVEGVAGRGSASVVSPIVAPEFGGASVREETRPALGLPPERPLVIVSGGGWGAGDVERAAEAALEVAGVGVVCLSGRNELLRRRLERRFAGEERLQVVPFTDRMPEYLAAADVLVDASLGVTCLEALRAGCRVVACGAPPGHSRDNARELARLGLAAWAPSPRELPPVLEQVLDLPAVAAPLPDAPHAAEAILAARPRFRPRPGRRRALVAAASGTLGALVLAGWTFASPTPYPVVARMFELGPLTQVDTSAPVLAVVVEAPRRSIPPLARDFAMHRMHVSFAVDAPPGTDERRVVARLHDDLLPLLSPAGTDGMLHARTQLLRLRQALRLGRSFYYVAPDGFTLGDYVAARTAGGLPVAAGPGLVPGAVLVIDARRRYGTLAVTALASALETRGLRAVPLPVLLASGARTRPTGPARARTSAPSPVQSSPTTRPASRRPDPGHHSPASTGARATGTNVASAKTIGAT
jgi:processive 1,2-diacylglycerol beta-glucosyltransferase